MRNYTVVPLDEFIGIIGSLELLEVYLGEFKCSRDTDVQSFLHNKAVQYEAKGFGRTYLAVDSATLDNGWPKIVAFFTLGLTSTDYSTISKSKKSKVLGSKPGRDAFKAFAGILIGQLARDDSYSADFISGKELLDECEQYIELGRKYLGGRIIYLDCKMPLVALYEKYGYKLLSPEPFTNGYYKMYKVLPDKLIT